MKSKSIFLLIVFPTVAGLFALLWFALVPAQKEPPYVFVAAFGAKGSGAGEFRDPTGIAVTGTGAGTEVFVADARGGRIQVFGPTGAFNRQFGQPGKGPG